MTRIPSKAVHYGRNQDITAYKDDRYVRCWNCGFPCHLDRDVRAELGSRAGDGISHTDAENAWGDHEWGDKRWGESIAHEPVVNAGCPQCGCLHYDRRR